MVLLRLSYSEVAQQAKRNLNLRFRMHHYHVLLIGKHLALSWRVGRVLMCVR